MEIGNKRSVVFHWIAEVKKMTEVSTQYGDIIYWCGQNNIQCGYGINATRFVAMDSTYYFIQFYNDEDLMAFKLRWM